MRTRLLGITPVSGEQASSQFFRDDRSEPLDEPLSSEAFSVCLNCLAAPAPFQCDDDSRPDLTWKGRFEEHTIYRLIDCVQVTTCTERHRRLAKDSCFEW